MSLPYGASPFDKYKEFQMTRRSRRYLRLRGAERPLFIIGAALYLIGLFGGLNLLAMPTTTAIILLSLGGGMLLITTLSLIW